MSNDERCNLLSVSDYLDAELDATLRHEYVDGHIFAMSGATEAHNLLCSNLSFAVQSHIRGSSCRLYQNDMKVRIKAANSFYYPDIVVTCEPFDAKSVFKDSPSLLVEVLSVSTMGTDKREKKIAYLKIPSLLEYLIVHQDRMQVELIRRSSDTEWITETFHAADTVVLKSLPNGELPISLNEIYNGYSPPGRVKELEESYNL